MDTKNVTYQTGKAQGQAEEKAKTLGENAAAATKSATDTVKEGGAQAQGAAMGAVDSVKKATGITK